MSPAPQPPARLLDLYRLMRRIRAFEDAAEVASQGGVAAWGLAASAKPALVRGPLHLSTGQEAVAAGVCAEPGAPGPAHRPPTAATATRWPRAPTRRA
jgi:TPP-dependent pyruvate/acetoin dehydrogenase alpha subunit